MRQLALDGRRVVAVRQMPELEHSFIPALTPVGKLTPVAGQSNRAVLARVVTRGSHRDRQVTGSFDRFCLGLLEIFFHAPFCVIPLAGRDHVAMSLCGSSGELHLLVGVKRAHCSRHRRLDRLRLGTRAQRHCRMFADKGRRTGFGAGGAASGQSESSQDGQRTDARTRLS
jgi:hypothetical protein